MALKTVVIGGGSGFIGKAIQRALTDLGFDVLIVSRQPCLGGISWSDLAAQGLPPSCTAVINLAGQNVLDPTRRWTAGFQQNVYASRIHTTKLLADEIKKTVHPPEVFGVISGVGYYRTNDAESCTEDSPGGDHDYFSRLCANWEEASNLPEELNVRRFIVRSGVVLGRKGGMISQLYWPFFFGLGGQIATGKQPMSWIHIDDIAGIFVHGVTSTNVTGVLNGVAPQLISNQEFTKAFAKAMWRPAVIPMPQFALNLAFGKERAAMMSDGQKVIPKRTLESGYIYKFPDINLACKSCV